MVCDPQRGCVRGRDYSPTTVEEVWRLREQVRILEDLLAVERTRVNEIRDDAERRLRIRQEQLEAAIKDAEYYEARVLELEREMARRLLDFLRSK